MLCPVCGVGPVKDGGCREVRQAFPWLQQAQPCLLTGDRYHCRAKLCYQCKLVKAKCSCEEEYEVLVIGS